MYIEREEASSVNPWAVDPVEFFSSSQDFPLAQEMATGLQTAPPDDLGFITDFTRLLLKATYFRHQSGLPYVMDDPLSPSSVAENRKLDKVLYGRLLADRRARTGFSMRVVPGISLGHISRVEHGQQFFANDKLESYLEALGPMVKGEDLKQTARMFTIFKEATGLFMWSTTQAQHMSCAIGLLEKQLESSSEPGFIN